MNPATTCSSGKLMRFPNLVWSIAQHRLAHYEAAAGAATGALIGAAIEENDARRSYPPPARGYPYAARTGTFGFVRSPYSPHRIVDVRGIPPGELVRDPSSGGIFRNP